LSLTRATSLEPHNLQLNYFSSISSKVMNKTRIIKTRECKSTDQMK